MAASGGGLKESPSPDARSVVVHSPAMGTSAKRECGGPHSHPFPQGKERRRTKCPSEALPGLAPTDMVHCTSVAETQLMDGVEGKQAQDTGKLHFFFFSLLLFPHSSFPFPFPFPFLFFSRKVRPLQKSWEGAGWVGKEVYFTALSLLNLMRANKNS